MQEEWHLCKHGQITATQSQVTVSESLHELPTNRPGFSLLEMFLQKLPTLLTAFFCQYVSWEIDGEGDGRGVIGEAVTYCTEQAGSHSSQKGKKKNKYPSLL